MKHPEIKGLKGAIADWESKFWSYLDSGDGIHCPLADNCNLLKEYDGLCIAKYALKYRRLFSSSCLRIEDCSFINSVSGASSELWELETLLANKFLGLGQVYYLPVPTDLLFEICRNDPVEIRRVTLKACHGATWPLKGRWITFLNAGDSRAMQRLTLFHEAFHILLNNNTRHRIAKPILNNYRTNCRRHIEVLADTFAVLTLMPKDLVTEEWRRVHDLPKMARIFDVPEPAALIQLRWLGLI